MASYVTLGRAFLSEIQIVIERFLLSSSSMNPVIKIPKKPAWPRKSIRIDVTGISQADSPLAIIETGKLMVKAWAKSLPPNEHIDQAHSFMVFTLTCYWRTMLPDTPAPLLSRNVKVRSIDEPVVSVAKAIGEAAAKLDVIEASYLLGNTYTAVLPESTRSSQGIFYTPPMLTRRLIQLSEDAGINWASARVVDPACGGGAFLAPVALKMRQALKHKKPSQIITHIESHLCGYDLDPFAAWMTQVFVAVVLKAELSIIGRPLINLVKVCNSLELPDLLEANRFDLVIANPPYGKLKLNDTIKKRYQDSLYGHPNYYGLFTHLTIDLVKKKGVIALLTPTSFLSGDYFKNLRSLLRSKTRPTAIDFVSVRKGVFEDVLQETMLAVYKKEEIDSKIMIHQIATGANNSLQIMKAGAFALPSDRSAPWILPRMPDQSHTVQAMEKMKERLVDWGYQVSTGPLVWNRHKKQLGNKFTGVTYPIIWAEAITQDGQFILRSERKNHEPLFKFKKGDDFLITKASCILLQRTTAKEQEKRLIAAALPASLLKEKGGVVVENHLNMLIPLTKHPPVAPEVLAAFLNSKAANLAFRAISGSVAVSAYELESFPLPDHRLLVKLSNLVIKKGSKDSIEAECLKLYQMKTHG